MITETISNLTQENGLFVWIDVLFASGLPHGCRIFCVVMCVVSCLPCFNVVREPRRSCGANRVSPSAAANNPTTTRNHKQTAAAATTTTIVVSCRSVLFLFSENNNHNPTASSFSSPFFCRSVRTPSLLLHIRQRANVATDNQSVWPNIRPVAVVVQWCCVDNPEQDHHPQEGQWQLSGPIDDRYDSKQNDTVGKFDYTVQPDSGCVECKIGPDRFETESIDRLWIRYQTFRDI